MRKISRLSIAAALLLGSASVAVAQDCPGTPLLGQRISVLGQLSHSAQRDTGLGASVTTNAAGPVRISGAYQATRLADIDHLAHDGRIGLSTAIGVGSVDVCPSIGVGYTRLVTEDQGMNGRVSTREAQLGVSLGKSFALSDARRATPFVEPLLVRRAVSWKSTDDAAWRIAGSGTAWESYLWLGLSVESQRHALIARYRPSIGSQPQAISFGVGVAFGKR